MGVDTVRRLSAAVTVGAPAAVLMYDWLVYAVWGREGTITAAVQELAKGWRELPFVAAGLFVLLWLHLFAAVVVREVMR